MNYSIVTQQTGHILASGVFENIEETPESNKLFEEIGKREVVSYHFDVKEGILAEDIVSINDAVNEQKFSLFTVTVK